VAIDGDGTAYIGWQVTTYADTGDAVQLCVLRRSGAKRTATVRLVPRHGRARTLRLPVRGCGRVA
jgi:hypothetical protein